jgi:hypothetical protein
MRPHDTDGYFDLWLVYGQLGETDKWTVSVQVHRSHDVESICKWQMLVKCINHRNAALRLRLQGGSSM